MDIYLIGDTHGNWNAVANRVRNLKDCLLISVGDLGIGYGHNHPTAERNLIGGKLNNFFQDRNIKFYGIRGNHDNPAWFDGSVEYSNFTLLADYTSMELNGQKWLFVGGATSVDRLLNVPGRSWWEDEIFILDETRAVKSDVLVTHAAPNFLGEIGSKTFVQQFFKKDKTLQQELVEEKAKLDKLYDLVRPNYWYLGHYHRSMFSQHEECKIRILDINELFLHEPYL